MPTRVNPIWYLNGCFFLVYFDAYMSISFDAYASQVSWDQDELKSPFKAFSKFITHDIHDIFNRWKWQPVPDIDEW